VESLAEGKRQYHRGAVEAQRPAVVGKGSRGRGREVTRRGEKDLKKAGALGRGIPLAKL